MNYTPVERIADASVERELYRVGEAMRTLQLSIIHLAPEKPADGMVVICDGTDWNPIGDGLKQPIWYDADVLLWKKF